jgi:uncharacterized Zn finger protein (UPF0148 family)
MQRANAEALIGKDPGKFKDPGMRWSQKRYNDMLRTIRQNETDRPVTILNLNPFFLEINGGVYFSGEQIAACPQDKPYTVHVIRDVRWGHKDLGCDAQNMMQMEPVPCIPLVLASEYIREYVQQDGGFGGVLCYVGDQDPATIKKGQRVRVPEIAYDETGEFYINVVDRVFDEILARVRLKRNNSLMNRLQSANMWYENEFQRMNVNDVHREMARMAVAEGLIPELPRWVMQQNTLMTKQPDPCPSCMSMPKEGAVLCTNCGHIFNVVAAYKNARIAYGAQEFDRLSAEEWKEVNAIKLERDKLKKFRMVDPPAAKVE